MCSNNSGESETLVKVAERLRLYQSLHGSHIIKTESPTELGPDGVRRSRAAVLICLFQGKDGDLRVILTKRSSAMFSHSGEVALPGGKSEEGDESDAATALREAKEEIGLEPSIVEVIASLHPFYTKDEKRRETRAELMGSKFLVHSFDYESEDSRVYTIWALTAAILIKAASIVYERSPAFDEQSPKFWGRSRH